MVSEQISMFQIEFYAQKQILIYNLSKKRMSAAIQKHACQSTDKLCTTQNG